MKTICNYNELPELYQEIYNEIGEGEGNAIHGRDIRAKIGLSIREVRAAIERIRRAGFVVCSSNSGYFRPGNLDELRRHIQRQRRLARSVLFTLRSARQLEKELALQAEFEARRLDKQGGVDDKSKSL